MISSTTSYQDTTETCDRRNAIVTAIPLLTAHNNEAQNNEDYRISSKMISNSFIRKRGENPSSSSQHHYYSYWNCILFLIGSLLGIFLSFVSLMSIESMYLRYGHEQKFPSTSNNNTTSSSSILLDRIIYIALLCLSHVRDAFNIAICVVFLCVLFAPKTCKDKVTTEISSWAGTTTDGRNKNNKMGTTTSIDDIYFMLVFLDGGFLVGSGFMLWCLAFVLGEPLPWSSFLGLCSVGFSVCYLLIICYNCTTKNKSDDDNNIEDEDEDVEDDEFAFVAIV